MLTVKLTESKLGVCDQCHLCWQEKAQITRSDVMKPAGKEGNERAFQLNS